MSDTNVAVDLFADFALDTTVEQNGVWVPYRDGVEFLVARAGNDAYRRKLAMLAKKHDRLLNQKTPAADAKSEEIFVDVLSTTVLLGWKGNLVFQGKPLEYSVDNAKLLLGHKLFRQWVTTQAEDEKAYKAVQEAEDAKN